MQGKKDAAHEVEARRRQMPNHIPTKRRMDFWYPRIMTIALVLNLLLQILVLALRW